MCLSAWKNEEDAIVHTIMVEEASFAACYWLWWLMSENRILGDIYGTRGATQDWVRSRRKSEGPLVEQLTVDTALSNYSCPLGRLKLKVGTGLWSWMPLSQQCTIRGLWVVRKQPADGSFPSFPGFVDALAKRTLIDNVLRGGIDGSLGKNGLFKKLCSLKTRKNETTHWRNVTVCLSPWPSELSRTAHCKPKILSCLEVQWVEAWWC